MTPEEALEKQIERYRAMTREQRAAIGLRLHELACEMSRVGIRRQHPSATPQEVEAWLRQRLELARTL
jgi:Rv0078B-related antitoxin